MRLNVEYYKALLYEKELSDEDVRKATAYAPKTFKHIISGYDISLEALERIADCLECDCKELAVISDRFTENVIEWEKNQERATLTLSQGRTISKVKKLAEKYPDQCEIVAVNKDGSVYAHIPTAWIKINPPMKLSDEQREEIGRRLKESRNL